MKKYSCLNCGYVGAPNCVDPIDNDLKATWGLSDALANLFNFREGTLCANCGVNARAQGLVKALLLSRFGFGKDNLKDWVEEANKQNLQICELNSCHNLHGTLLGLKNLTYAEYGTPTEQNIEKLTYPDNSFDIVLHSETVEHVNDPAKAMNECRRVLKENGLIIFTTPVIWSRSTKQRARIVNSKIEHIAPPSYHGFKTDDYLVFYEYGHDIDRKLKVNTLYEDWKNQNYVFVSNKKGNSVPFLKKIKLRLRQQLVVKLNLGS